MTEQARGRCRRAAGGAVALVAGALTLMAAGCGTRPTSAGARPAGTAATAAPTTSPAPATTRPTTPAPTSTATTRPPATTTTAAAAATPACAPGLAASLATTRGARQLVTAVAPTPASTAATVELWQRQGSCWVDAGGPWPGMIGANGFSDHKREGDDTAPTGIYSISPASYGNDANPGVRGTYHQLVCGDWWDEDPTSPAYNTFQHVACGTRPPFAGGSEALWTETAAYPSFAVVDYNTDPVVPYAGSAIFLHADIGGPTAGCVSLPLADLDQMLRWLDPAAQPMIAMGPAGEISRF